MFVFSVLNGLTGSERMRMPWAVQLGGPSGSAVHPSVWCGSDIEAFGTMTVTV